MAHTLLLQCSAGGIAPRCKPFALSLDKSVSASFSKPYCESIRKRTHGKWLDAKTCLVNQRRNLHLVCKAAEYKFPDPIPEFAEAETEKFKNHLLDKLSKKDLYGDSVEEIVGICAEILNNFLHTEYGGPGTLLVNPFIDMADNLNEKGLPGGPQAARAAVKWAQKHVDNDWNQWTSNGRS